MKEGLFTEGGTASKQRLLESNITGEQGVLTRWVTYLSHLIWPELTRHELRNVMFLRRCLHIRPGAFHKFLSALRKGDPRCPSDVKTSWPGPDQKVWISSSAFRGTISGILFNADWRQKLTFFSNQTEHKCNAWVQCDLLFGVDDYNFSHNCLNLSLVLTNWASPTEGGGRRYDELSNYPMKTSSSTSSNIVRTRYAC